MKVNRVVSTNYSNQNKNRVLNSSPRFGNSPNNTTTATIDLANKTRKLEQQMSRDAVTSPPFIAFSRKLSDLAEMLFKPQPTQFTPKEARLIINKSIPASYKY